MRLPFALIATCLILSGCAGSLGPQGDPWIRGQLGDAISCDACTVTLEGDVWTVTVGESGSLVWTGQASDNAVVLGTLLGSALGGPVGGLVGGGVPAVDSLFGDIRAIIGPPDEDPAP